MFAQETDKRGRISDLDIIYGKALCDSIISGSHYLINKKKQLKLR